MTRGRRLLIAVPLALVAAVLLWLGDARLAHREWLAGGAVFALGLGATFLAVRQLRLAGLVR